MIVIKSLYDKNCPFKKVRLKSKANVPPWLSKSLLKAYRKKNKLYKFYIKNKNEVNERKYKCYKNRLTTILRFCEKKYYSDLLIEHSNNVKKTWSVINKILKKRKNNANDQEKFIGENSQIVTHKNKIANGFNIFFCGRRAKASSCN